MKNNIRLRNQEDDAIQYDAKRCRDAMYKLSNVNKQYNLTLLKTGNIQLHFRRGYS